mgnify:CR=1 FL=1
MFDHTLLKAFAKKEDFEVLCRDADQNGFKMVAINSYPVKLCKSFLKDSPVHVGAAIIFENSSLTNHENRQVALIAKKVKPNFIKTSPGFGTSGATLEDVILMRDTVDGTCQIKAAGGIRDWATAKAFIEAGVTRIGTSSSFDILRGYDEEQANK